MSGDVATRIEHCCWTAATVKAGAGVTTHAVWAPTCPDPLLAEVYAIKEEIEDKSLAYPDYYTVPFHGERAGKGATACRTNLV
jgi:hypothetical protein